MIISSCAFQTRTHFYTSVIPQNLSKLKPIYIPSLISQMIPNKHVMLPMHSNINDNAAIQTNETVKKGKLYFTIWGTIYLSCLITIFYAVDHDLLQAEKYGINPQTAMCSLCDWLDKHVINVYWITSRLRTNPWMTKFMVSYLLTDLVPTTFIALACYPVVINYQSKQQKFDM